MFRLDGRSAPVTGAARGIGTSVAAAFARVGAAVLVTDIEPEPPNSSPSVRTGSGTWDSHPNQEET
jgi:NAD(P)-dependent dehydrogenase (short-subunit alcohol dehydrogenase family)